MLEGGQIFSIISLAAGGLCLTLGLFVFWKNPFLKVSQLFILTVSLATIACVMDFLLINSPDQGTALFFGRTTMFVTICIAGSLLYISCFLPYERIRSPIVVHKWSFLTLIVAVATIPALLTDAMVRDEYGWWLPSTLSVTVWIVIAFALCLAAIVLLTSICIRSKREDVRRQCTILSCGAGVPVVYGFAILATNAGGVNTPPMLSAIIFITGLIFSYAVIRHRLFLIEPVKEAMPPHHVNDTWIKEREGQCNLFEGKKGDDAYELFVTEVAAGRQGLIISRTHPDQIRERYGLVKTPVIWLSTQPGPDRLEPTSITILQHTIVEFLQRGNGSVVLLDGMEYLSSNNSMEKVLQLIYTVHDAVVISRSTLVVPLDPDVLAERYLALLEREFDVVESGNGAGSEI